MTGNNNCRGLFPVYFNFSLRDVMFIFVVLSKQVAPTLIIAPWKSVNCMLLKEDRVLPTLFGICVVISNIYFI